MVKKMVVIGALFVTSLFADPVTLVSKQDSWQYSTISTDLWSDWSAASYNSVDWNSFAWQNGQAGFGNSSVGSDVSQTIWNANQDLALQKNIVIDGALDGNVTLNVAVDNGAMIFVNGVQIFKANEEGFTSYWEYSSLIDNSPFVVGDNQIRVLTEDHGGLTYFDMELKGNVTTNVPEPATASMLLLGLVGLIGRYRTRNRKS